MSIRDYHNQTKHHPHAIAPGPGRMDWANQPDPFRRFAGAPVLELPLLADRLETRYADVRAGASVTPAPFSLESVAQLLELSLGLSAWKALRGHSWALRCNPSSGNLHPTEGYLVCGDLPGLAGGVHHYCSERHTLEQRAQVDWQGVLGDAGIVIGLTSIVWREAWKYGSRAYRYCQHDIGHAAAAVRYAAAALGWPARLLSEPSDSDVAALLGLEREDDFAGAEAELPECLLWLGDPDAIPSIDTLTSQARGAVWQGQANALSPDHVHWPQIEHAEAVAVKPRTADEGWQPPEQPALQPVDTGIAAADLYRQRRSAVDFDGVTGLGLEAFTAMLDALLPRSGIPPWDALPWQPMIHPFFFVHRVRGLQPGLYALPRRQGVHEALEQATREGFAWAAVPGVPEHIPLLELAEGDVQQTARVISCMQDIGGDSAFSLGMIGEYEAALGDGDWGYRRLFWEAGTLGQVLYLEAEIAGLRGTGIGCYFDNLMHEALGLQDSRFQDIYHFTVGGHVEDSRLTTLPPYAHLPPRG